ncbi:MAG: PTS sugar transporter subunit IIA [Elusimicrobia bacterium]|nr:PTS sugar transporter subunit IIA [Elusimicrobiota bacterium]
MAKTLADLLGPKSVLVPLKTATLADAVSQLVGALPLDAPEDRAALKAAVLAREAAGSTGIGAGVAIPHARWAKALRPLMAAGLSERPIDFKSADGRPVSLVFLLAVPIADYAAHLKALAAVSRLAADKTLLRRLLKAPSAEALYGLLAGAPL